MGTPYEDSERGILSRQFSQAIVRNARVGGFLTAITPTNLPSTPNPAMTWFGCAIALTASPVNISVSTQRR